MVGTNPFEAIFSGVKRHTVNVAASAERFTELPEPHHYCTAMLDRSAVSFNHSLLLTRETEDARKDKTCATSRATLSLLLLYTTRRRKAERSESPYEKNGWHDLCISDNLDHYRKNGCCAPESAQKLETPHIRAYQQCILRLYPLGRVQIQSLFKQVYETCQQLCLVTGQFLDLRRCHDARSDI